MAARIGLWGVPTSGKTTMLAALQSAIDERRTGSEDWILFGADRESSDFLGRQIQAVAQRQFPPATIDQARRLTFSMVKSPHESWLVRTVRRRARRGQFDLTLLDVPGRYYGTDPRLGELPAQADPAALDRGSVVFGDEHGADLFDEQPRFGQAGDEVGSTLFDGAGGPVHGDDVDQLVDHLARADGIVFLFDPVRELQQEGGGRDAYLHLRSMLERVSGRANQLGRLTDGKLPHYLAVCINKLDEPVVFDRALKGGFLGVGDDDTASPTVTGDDARDFFRALCTGREAGDGPVLGAIEGHFHRRRTRYFATSSVGFYIGPGGVFRIQDYRNVTDGKMIRSRIRPVNVIEPFLWLEEAVRKNRPPQPVEPPRPPASGAGEGPPPAGPENPEGGLTDVDGIRPGGAADGDLEDGYLDQPPAGQPVAAQPAADPPPGWTEPEDLANR